MSDAADPPATAEASAPSAPSEGGVHRLLDMLVEEVSLVDRAANKRRFLVVKRESEMPKKKTEETTPAKPGAVGATAGGGAGRKPPPKAKKPPKKPDDETEKGKKPPAAKDPPEEEEDEEDEDGKTSKAFPPKKDPDEEEEEEEQEEEPGDAPASEDEPSGKPPGKKPPKKKAEKDEDGAPALGAPDDETPDDDETPLSIALAALDSLTQAVEILSDSPEDGSQLASVAEGIRAAADAISSAAGIEPDNDEEPGGEASIAGLVSSIQEMLTKIESLTQALSAESKTPATAPTITAETQAPPDLAGTLAEVSQSMKSLDASVKAQAARLSALEKRAGVPNSQPPGERVTKTEPEDASWPIDMNRPRDRASVDKAVSFHDD
ncbi:MAG: hypothetical protein ACLQVI_25000 [Polyangiaceae bacterium]